MAAGNMPAHASGSRSGSEGVDETDMLLQWVRSDIIGNTTKTYTGPYGSRRIIFCDYIASARAMKTFERYIEAEVLPW